MTMFVRIKPQMPREKHVIGGVTITKSKRWHEVTDAIAEMARDEPLSDLNPASPLLFDVKTYDQAKAIDEAEAYRADPSGTPDQPVRVGLPAAAPTSTSQASGDAAAPRARPAAQQRPRRPAGDQG